MGDLYDQQIDAHFDNVYNIYMSSKKIRGKWLWPQFGLLTILEHLHVSISRRIRLA